MGIARGAIKLLMRLGLTEEYRGSVLTLGRQDVFGTSEQLRKWANEMNFPLKASVELPKKGRLTDVALLLSLGFENVDSMDNSNFEGSTIIHDLNNDVPYALHDKYEVVLDCGTSEHVFNFPKVLESSYKMLKTGGRVIHLSPSSNYVDHGFYMFSPTLFHDYYSANLWHITSLFFIKHSRNHDTELWDIYKYEPGSLDRLAFGGLNKGLFSTLVVAQKTQRSTCNARVQQSIYQRKWQIYDATILGEKAVSGGGTKLGKLLPKFLRDPLRRFYMRHLYTVVETLRAKLPLRFYLKLVARY